MILKTNHPDKDISNIIMEYLYDYCEIKGNEEQLKDEPFTDFLTQDEIWKIEKEIAYKLDREITLPEDLKLIEDKSLIKEVPKASDIFKILGETQINFE
jgi:hypothetical protein